MISLISFELSPSVQIHDVLYVSLQSMPAKTISLLQLMEIDLS